MVSEVYSVAVNGLLAQRVDVQVDINSGIPAFTIVGLPDQGVQESRERIRSALKSSNMKLPRQKITVNLAPAGLRKMGPSFDFAIAIAILLADETLPFDKDFFDNSIFLGELSLDGKLRSVRGVLPSALWAKDNGIKNIFVPSENEDEARIISGINIFPLESLSNFISGYLNNLNFRKAKYLNFEDIIHEYIYTGIDFRDIVGQEMAKRALEISAAGGHNLIMNGPPGSGKSMLSKAFRGILPRLTLDESIEITKIYSIAGLLTKERPLILERPFRKIHHTASSASIIGGGRNATPGEISLAHKGVLFMDEILEFPKNVLEILRQPLEDGTISVTRVNGSFEYPAQFSLLAAMNPCPCGYLTDPDKNCSCSQYQVSNYQSKLSGPLLDRIDIYLEVPKVRTKQLESQYNGADSTRDINQRVQAAHEIQLRRYKNLDITSNSELTSKLVRKYCVLGKAENEILSTAVKNYDLSARSYFRILKLSRTIADLGGKKDIGVGDILEALNFRIKEYQ